MQPVEVAHLLKEGIREGWLTPGQPLVQDELAKRFNVSRIPIREALRLLEAEGMVEARTGGGHAVTRLSSTSIGELYDLRIQLEAGLAPHIVENASSADQHQWRAMLQAMREYEGDTTRWFKANYDFHVSLYSASRRAHTVRLVRSLMDQTLPYVRIHLSEPSAEAAFDNEHAALLDAIEAGQADTFSTVIAEHLRETQQALIRALDADARSAGEKKWFG